MNENDRKRLVELRIDEFCAQNAISRDELDALEAEIGGAS